MTATDHVHLASRAHVRLLFASAALAVLPVAHAAPMTRAASADGFTVIIAGKTATFGWSDPNSFATKLSMSTPSGAATSLGKTGIYGAADGVSVATDVSARIAGRDVAVRGTQKLAAASLGKALAKAIPLVGTAFAIGEILEAIGAKLGQDSDGKTLIVGSGGGAGDRACDAQGACVSYSGQYSPAKYSTPANACAGNADGLASYNGKTKDYSTVQQEWFGFRCIVYFVEGSYGGFDILKHVFQGIPNDTGAPAGGNVLTEDSLADKIAKQSGWPTAAQAQLANLTGFALNNGASIDTDGLNVSGPKELTPTSETTTTSNSDGTTTEKKTTTTPKIGYSGKTATVTDEKTTTTTTKDSNGNVIKTETTKETNTSSNSTKEQENDLCKTNPNIAACADLDTPEGEIPRKTKTITYAPEGDMGGGGCPADRPIGRDYVFSYASTCSTLVTFVRPLVILIAGWMATVIIFGIGKADA